MPLTPADIHNMAFKKPPLGKRGYDEEEVDAFLDEAEQQMIRLLEENESLRGHLHQGGGPGPGPAAPSSGAAMSAEHAALAAQLDRAQQDRARAEQQARGLQAQLEQAPSAAPAPIDRSDRGSAVMMMAQRTADDHLADARRESESLIAAARDKSVQITGEAQAKARTTEGDARRNHTEAMNSLEAKRNALLDEIERLSQLAAGYQEALNHHIAQQLQDMEGVHETTAVGAG